MEFMLNISTSTRFKEAFIEFDRWKLYFKGLGVTLQIALLAILIGVAIGVFFAMIKYVNKKTKKLKILNSIADLYILIVRGTPVVLQMLIMYTVVFVSSLQYEGMEIIAGGLTFGLNSAAYVAEIVRAGFESIDDGQMEAGRSLGMTTSQTMKKIITPQAIRNVMPPLFNEFIVLVKETAIVGFVGVKDLGKIPNDITGITLDRLPPLLIAAAFYLVVVLFLTAILKLIEKKFSKSDRTPIKISRFDKTYLNKFLNSLKKNSKEDK